MIALGKKLAGWAGGANWYLYGGILAVLLISHTSAYQIGKYRERVAAEQEKVVEVQTKLVTIVKEVEKRVPVVQIREVESAKQRAEIAVLKEKLDDAINQRPDLPQCALSESEFDAINELSKRTKTR